jgi:hypothetical protein
LFQGDCGHPDSFEMAILRADDATEVDHQTFTWSEVSAEGILSMTPAVELDPGTDYTLQAIPQEGWGEVSEIGFTTGSGHVVGISGVPSVAITAASWERSTFTLTDDYTATAAEDPDALSVLVLSDPDSSVTPWAFAAPRTGTTERRATLDATSFPAQACLAITQIDGLGERTDGETSCADVERIGCDAAGGRGLGGVLGIAALGLSLVRRRAR